MNVVAYFRFAWAGQIAVDYLTSTPLVSSLGQKGLVLNIFRGLFALTFVLYCCIIGVQDLQKRQFVEGAYFYIFGTLYEVMIFLWGLYILSVVVGPDLEIWRV